MPNEVADTNDTPDATNTTSTPNENHVTTFASTIPGNALDASSMAIGTFGWLLPYAARDQFAKLKVFGYLLLGLSEGIIANSLATIPDLTKELITERKITLAALKKAAEYVLLYLPSDSLFTLKEDVSIYLAKLITDSSNAEFTMNADPTFSATECAIAISLIQVTTAIEYYLMCKLLKKDDATLAVCLKKGSQYSVFYGNDYFLDVDDKKNGWNNSAYSALLMGGFDFFLSTMTEVLERIQKRSNQTTQIQPLTSIVTEPATTATPLLPEKQATSSWRQYFCCFRKRDRSDDHEVAAATPVNSRPQ